MINPWTTKGFFIVRTDFDDPTRWAHKSLYNHFPWAVVQAHDGLTETNTDNIRAWIREAQIAGLTVGLWGFLRTDPEAEAALGDHLIREYNAAFWIANAEAEYKTDTGGDRARAQAYVDAFAALQPTIARGFSTYGASGSPLGDVTDASAGVMDFKAWYDGGYQFLPQTFPYDLSEVMDHAAACGIPVGRVSPTLAIYDGAFGRTLEDWQPIAAAEGVSNYNIYLAEQTRTLQQDPNWQEGDPTPPPSPPDPPPVPPPSEGGLPSAAACSTLDSGDAGDIVFLGFTAAAGSEVVYEWQLDAEVLDSDDGVTAVDHAWVTWPQQIEVIEGVTERHFGGHRAAVVERVRARLGPVSGSGLTLHFEGDVSSPGSSWDDVGTWAGSLEVDNCVDYTADGSGTRVTLATISDVPITSPKTMHWRYSLTIQTIAPTSVFAVVAGISAIQITGRPTTTVILNSRDHPLIEGTGESALATGATPSMSVDFFSGQGGLHEAHMRVCADLEFALSEPGAPPPSDDQMKACGKITIIAVIPPVVSPPEDVPDSEPDAFGICFSFTPDVYEPPVWTRVDDPGGI